MTTWTTTHRTECFELQRDAGIAHLVLNRPEQRNTLNLQFWRELHELLRMLHSDGSVRALVISSTGEHFSAGMDLQVFSSDIALDDTTPQGRAAICDLLAELQHTFTCLEQLRVPVIAAIQGACVGGALDLVAACCLRYTDAQAFFCIQEINVGMVADVGTLQRLPKLVPMAIVKELAYTGRRWPAAQAQQWGFVNEVLPSADACRDAALQAARTIASKPPVAIWGTKQVLHYARDHSVDDSLRQMGWVQAAIWSNANVQEAIGAFQKRRASQFPDLAPLTHLHTTPQS